MMTKSSPKDASLFLSQRVVQTRPPPPVLPAKQHGRCSSSCGPAELRQGDKTNDETWQWKIEAHMVPSLNMYYMLEPTSITLKQIPLRVVEERMSNFLRLQSISHTYDAGSVRLNCVTSNMLKFVVHFWRVGGGRESPKFEDPNKALTVELQRRQGSVIEMQNVRKMMFRTLLTGEQPAIPTGDEKFLHRPLPDTIMAEIGAKYDQEAVRADAFEISLRLLESRCIDQSRLGLESLKMLTDPSIVSQQDAAFASRAIVFQEGDYGVRVQACLAGYFRDGDSVGQEYYMNYEDTTTHSMALLALANALQLASEDTFDHREQPAALDVTSAFWKLVIQDLFKNVETAMTKPHEGAISLKCIRLLSTLQTRGSNVSLQALTFRRDAGLRSVLTRAHQYGQSCHLSLERESQKLLTMDNDGFILAH